MQAIRRNRGADASRGAVTGPPWGAVAALGLASLFIGGCNAVLGIDEAELCSAPDCAGMPEFVQGATEANTPRAGRERDAGLDDAGGGVAGTGGLLAPAREPAPGSGGSGGGSEGLQPVSSGGSTGTGTGTEAPGASVPIDSPEPDDSGDGQGGGGDTDDDADDGNGNSGEDEGDGDGDGEGDGDGDDPEPAPPPAAPPPPPPPPTPCTGLANGEVLCDGATRVTCGPEGSVSSAEPCPSAAHCAQGTGPSCAACLDGEARCEGTLLLTCNATRSALDVQDCFGTALCNAAQARCDAAACQPNSLQCDGSVLQVCNATLTGFDPLVDCGAPEACNAASGGCNLCAPGTARCLDPDTVLACDVTGQVEIPRSCGLLEVCSAGQCVIGLSL